MRGHWDKIEIGGDWEDFGAIPGCEGGVSAVDVEREEGAGDDDDVGHEGVRQEGREAPPRHHLHPEAAVVGCMWEREHFILGIKIDS